MAKYAYHRLDANHKEIVEVFEALGCTVEPIGRPVDLLVGYSGRNWLIEIKTPKGELNERQERFFREWIGQVTIVQSALEAIAAFHRLRQA